MKKNIVFAVVGSVVTLAGVVALIWWGMGFVPANVARLWALLATAGLPLAVIFGKWLGSTEARGTLRGLDLGVSKIFGPAIRGTRRRGYMGRAAQYVNPVYAQPQVIALPEVEFNVAQDNTGTVNL